MLTGSCHCNAVSWQFDGVPESATACNCTVCRRYGALWAYGSEGENVHLSGPTTHYIRGDSIEFHFCASCGCVACWRSREPDEQGRHRLAVNLRLAEPGAVGAIAVSQFEGLESFTRLPGHGRCVADYWF